MAAIHGTMENLWTRNYSEEILSWNNVYKSSPSTAALILGIILTTIAPLIALANGIVIYAIWKDPFKNLRSSPSNILIASMASCDFLVGLVCSASQAALFLSVYTKAFKVTNFWSPIAGSIGTFLIGVSMFHILALTIDRVIAVADPLRYRSRVTRAKTCAAILFIWVFLSFLIVIRVPLENHYYIYSLISNLVFNATIIIVTILSWFIIIHVRKQTRNLKRNSELNINLKVTLLRDKKTTRSILFIMAVFKMCFIPIFVTEAVILTCTSCHSNLNEISIILCFSFLLTHVNSCLNPFIYAFRLPKFRKPVALITKQIFCCKRYLRVHDGHTLESSNTISEVKHSKGKRNKIYAQSSRFLDTRL